MKRTPEDWIIEIDDALEYRKQFSMESHWSNIEQAYMHDPNSGMTAVGPNLIYSHGDSLMSSLTVPDPEFLIAPETQKAVQTAPILERLDNQFVKKLKMKRAVEDALLTAFLNGKGIIKLGYDSLYGYDPYYDIGDRKNFFGITTTAFSKTGKRLEFGSQKPGWPWAEAISPKDFVVPWGVRYIENAPWAAHRFIRRVDLIKTDPKYRNTSRLEGDMNMEEFMKSYENVGAVRQKYATSTKSAVNANATYLTNRKALFKEFWEIRDMESGKIFVVARDYDKFLRNDPDAIMAAMGGLPFVCGDLVKHPHSFWTTPLAYYLGQIQSEQFDISLQAAKQRRISILKFLVRKGMMSEEQLTRIMSGDVGAYEEVEAGTGLSMNDIIGTLPTGNMYDFQVNSENNRRDARDMIGFSRNQLGEYDSSSRRTAREATFVQQGSEQRTDKRTQTVVRLYLETIEKCNKLVFAFWQTPRDVLMESGWQSVTGPQLASDYAYDLSLSTKRNLSKAQRKVEAFQVLLQMAQFPGVNLQELYRMLIAAANDPSFERLLPAPGSNQGGRSPSGGLPTVPGTA